MIDAIFIFIVLYLLAGVLIAEAVDRKQMREHVPYGDFPSVFRLEQIRAAIFPLMMLAGPVIFLKVLVELLFQHLARKRNAV